MKKKLRKVGALLPKKLVLHIDYSRSYKKILNLKNPQYYGEKIQWIKLNGNLEQYANYVDKYEVREFVESILGKEYLPKLYGVYTSEDEINFEELPDKFVLKMTNGSGGNIIVKNKETINQHEIMKKLNNWRKETFYKYTKEDQYKNIKSRIICEEYLEDETGSLRDYKFHCAMGKIELIEIHTDRYTDHKENYYDSDWNDYGVSCKVKIGKNIPKPGNLDEMKVIASTLSKHFPYVRVDLYSVNNRIFFGELTFTPANGTDPFYPLEKDLEIAKIINLNHY